MVIQCNTQSKLSVEDFVHKLKGALAHHLPRALLAFFGVCTNAIWSAGSPQCHHHPWLAGFIIDIKMEQGKLIDTPG